VQNHIGNILWWVKMHSLLRVGRGNDARKEGEEGLRVVFFPVLASQVGQM
jgi:hypothetical protein